MTTKGEETRPDHVQGIPARVEYSTEEDVDCLDLYADDADEFSPVPSDSDVLTESYDSRHWEEEEKFQERFLRTKSTRDPKGSLASKIALDKVQWIECKVKDKLHFSASSSKDTILFKHNVATMWMTLGDVGSPHKQTTPGKARVLSCIPSASPDQADSTGPVVTLLGPVTR